VVAATEGAAVLVALSAGGAQATVTARAVNITKQRETTDELKKDMANLFVLLSLPVELLTG